MSHSLHMSKLQSELEYKKGFEDTKSQCHVPLDMIHLVHARKAQHLATDIGYKTASHHFTALPTDMKVEWAKKAYSLQSDVSSSCVCVYVCVRTSVSQTLQDIVCSLRYLFLDPSVETFKLLSALILLRAMSILDLVLPNKIIQLPFSSWHSDGHLCFSLFLGWRGDVYVTFLTVTLPVERAVRVLSPRSVVLCLERAACWSFTALSPSPLCSFIFG